MTTRQEIYDRIRASSRDEYILTEMIRLGFWPKEGEMPEDPADEVRQRAQLQQELRALITESSRLEDADRIRREVRKQRMAESRRKRAETKQRRIEQRRERAAAWRKRKGEDLVYLGEEVSCGLQDQQSNRDKLTARGLPALDSPAQLAEAMGTPLGELRFLAFHRRTAPISHYQRFTIKKKSGGLRQISAPMPRLKRAQEWILRQILDKVQLHDAANGFRPGRSIVSNAEPHVDADVVVNLDLEDFFPTVTYPRIKGLFRNLGYSDALATVMALICSEPPRTEVELDGVSYHVARGPRVLPQGAPSSPAITNILCRGLDARLSGLASSLGFRYTRYADDITFSGSGEARENVGRVLRRTRHIVHDEKFRVHPNKTRVLRRGRRQEVTGLTVNRRVSVSRRELRRFRAVLFQIDRDGPAGKRWGGGGNLIESIEGFANFVAMVDAERGRILQEQVRRIIEKHGRGPRNVVRRARWKPRPLAEPASLEPQAAESLVAGESTDAPAATSPAAEAKPAKRPWWKFW